jgi:hypothetical protein
LGKRNGTRWACSVNKAFTPFFGHGLGISFTGFVKFVLRAIAGMHFTKAPGLFFFLLPAFLICALPSISKDSVVRVDTTMVSYQSSIDLDSSL